MADAKLGILISADPNQALAGLDKLNGGLDKTNDQIKILDGQFQRLQKIASMPGLSFAQQQRLNTMLAGTKAELDKAKRSFDLASPSIQKFQSTSSAATQSTMNFGRVIQDLPYGFMGIANNLNPLLESFQRLQASTGSASGAFKALGKDLIGAGGIGLAISLVSTGLVLFGDKLFGAKTKAVEFDKELINLTLTAQRVDESIKALSVSLDNLQEFANITIDANFTDSAEKKLLKAQVASVKLDEELFKVKNSLGTIEKAAGDAFDLMQKKLSQKGLNTVREFNFIGDVPNSVVDKLSKKDQEYVKAAQDLYKQLGETQNKVGELTTQRDLARANIRLTIIENERDAQEKAAEELSRLREKQKQEVEKYISGAKKLLNEFSGSGLRLTVLPIFSELDTKREALEKAKQIYADINGFFKDFTSKDRKLNVAVPFSFEIEQPPESVVTKQVTEFGDLYKDEIQKYFNSPITVDVTIDAAVKLEEREKSIGALFGIKFDPKDNPFTDIEKKAIVAAKTIQDIMVPAFQGLFDAILDGESPIKSFFQSLGQAVGQLIQKLISAAVTAAILSAVFPGGFGGVKGFGAIFGNLLGFAEGGRPPTDKPSVVGETGREIFVPDRPGVILPNRVTEKILSGGLFGKIFGGGRKSGGSVFPGFFYETGEEGREMYFPYNGSEKSGFKMPNLYNVFKSSPSIQIKPMLSFSSVGTGNQSVLQPAFSNESRDQYIPMLKNGELGLLIKRGQKHIRNNS